MSAVTEKPPPRGAEATAASLPAILAERARRTPHDLAMRKKVLGRWKPYTWETYALRVSRLAAGLRSLGVVAGDRVAILSENRPAWVLADLAAQSIGAVSVGIYPTSPPSEVGHLLRHSRSVVLIAENEEQLDKALIVREQLPELRWIVIVDRRGVEVNADAMLMTFADLEEPGSGATVADLAADAARLEPNAPTLIVYTSGTTGLPKGALISQANLMAAATAAGALFDVGPRDDVLSYVPLCHITERLVSVIGAIGAGYVVNFGEGGESFQGELCEVQPTLILGLPRVWELLMAGVEIRMDGASRIKRATYRFWMARGAALAERRMVGSLGLGGRVVYLAGSLVLYRPLRRKLGLLRVHEAISGAAPISPRVLRFFWALGVPIREGYGLTENTGQATTTPRDDVRIGKVGPAVPGAEVSIAADGEILTRGPTTFLGYLDDPAATAAALDDGWLHTGDRGALDDDGFLTVTGRQADIIVTADERIISPSRIEDRLKVSPFIREAVVIGEGRPYLAALIGVEPDTVGAWASSRDLLYTTFENLVATPEVQALIEREVASVNADVGPDEAIKIFRLLPRELEEEDGELTPTQRVKRPAVARVFAELIESMYRDPTP